MFKYNPREKLTLMDYEKVTNTTQIDNINKKELSFSAKTTRSVNIWIFVSKQNTLLSDTVGWVDIRL